MSEQDRCPRCFRSRSACPCNSNLPPIHPTSDDRPVVGRIEQLADTREPTKCPFCGWMYGNHRADCKVLKRGGYLVPEKPFTTTDARIVILSDRLIALRKAADELAWAASPAAVSLLTRPTLTHAYILGTELHAALQAYREATKETL